MRRLSLAALLALALWLPGHSASALTVTLNGVGTSNLFTGANDQSAGVADETVYPVALPYSYTSTSVDGAASAESQYDLSNGGFQITFAHARTASYGTQAHSYGHIYFSVDQDIDYVASGSYAATDSEGRRIRLIAFLYDYTSGSVFDSRQESRSTSNESFTLGLTEGDFDNVATGSLTGTLIAGHSYEFFYGAYLDAYPTASLSGATASGSVSLSFVPEPSTALLLGLGLILTGLRHRN